jgi:hypothetical protein
MSAWTPWAARTIEQPSTRPEDPPTLDGAQPAVTAGAPQPELPPGPPIPVGAWAPTTVVPPGTAHAAGRVQGTSPLRRWGVARIVAMTAAATAALLGAVMLAQPGLFGTTAASTSPSSTIVAAVAEETLPAEAAGAPAAEGGEAAKAGGGTAQRRTAAGPAPQSGNVQVVKKGFTQLPRELDGDQKVVYAVLLENPRSDQVAVDVRTVVTLTGRGSVPLKVKDERLDSLLPGQVGAVADDSEVAGVRGMRVQVLVGRWAPAQGLAGRLSASSVQTRRVAGELLTTARVRSSLTLGDAEAVAVYYNRSGQVIGGHTEDIDSVPAGATVPVAIDSSHPLRGVAKTEVYTNPELFSIDD